MPRRQRMRIIPQLVIGAEDAAQAPRDVVIVDPRLSRMWLDEAADAVAGSAHHAELGIRVVRRSFPTIIVELYWRAAARRTLLHVQADNYDYRPPRGWWVDEGGAPLRAGQVPTGGGFQPPPNPYSEDKSWLCLPGWREYHDHHSHQGNPWQSIKHRKEYGLSGLLVQLQQGLNGEGVAAP